MPTKRPTDQDRIEALRRFLVALDAGRSAHDIVADVADLHVRHNTFPGEVFMELAADALELAEVERSHPVSYENLLATFLPEAEFKGKENRRIQYAILTAFAVRGGLEPDLLEEVTYWIEQYWQYALLATVAILRASAAHREVPVSALLAELAARHDIDLAELQGP